MQGKGVSVGNDLCTKLWCWVKEKKSNFLFSLLKFINNYSFIGFLGGGLEKS